MTPLMPEQIESIMSRLSFLEQEISDLAQLRSTTWKIYSTNNDVRRNIERLTENVANASIDIAKLILAGDAMEMPRTYKEVMDKLVIIKVIPLELSEKLKELIGLRNFLAHQYLDLKWDKIKSFLTDGEEIIKQFAGLVQKVI